MNLYRVLVREVHLSHRVIEADTPEAALDMAGDELEVKLEYSHTLDQSMWTVEKEGT